MAENLFGSSRDPLFEPVEGMPIFQAREQAVPGVAGAIAKTIGRRVPKK